MPVEIKFLNVANVSNTESRVTTEETTALRKVTASFKLANVRQKGDVLAGHIPSKFKLETTHPLAPPSLPVSLRAGSCLRPSRGSHAAQATQRRRPAPLGSPAGPGPRRNGPTSRLDGHGDSSVRQQQRPTDRPGRRLPNRRAPPARGGSSSRRRSRDGRGSPAALPPPAAAAPPPCAAAGRAPGRPRSLGGAAPPPRRCPPRCVRRRGRPGRPGAGGQSRPGRGEKLRPGARPGGAALKGRLSPAEVGSLRFRHLADS
ncbi:uncharacterized protein J5F26_008589 [Ciconia maguari]